LKLNYDIFRKPPGDGFIWIEAIENLEAVRLRLSLLMESHPGEYFVYDHLSGKTIPASALDPRPRKLASVSGVGTAA